MSMIRVSRLAALLAAFSLAAPWTARADAPNACKFLSNAAVSAVVGKPVTGGTTSVVDHPGASASSCSYMAGMTIVLISVDERGTGAAALKESIILASLLERSNSLYARIICRTDLR
jgi:hypothetical protein